jgi:hypothetical protein
MTAWDRGDRPEPSEESLAHVRAGRNAQFSGFKTDADADPRVAKVLTRYRETVAQATEEAFVELVRPSV